MVATSFAEIISIGAVLPFLGVLTAPDRIFDLPIAQPAIQFLSLTESKQLLLPLTIIFSTAAIAAGGMRMLLLWFSTRLSSAAGADLSMGIYRRTLYQPYVVHVSRNSSAIINGISGKTTHAIGVINMVLNFISSSVMIFTILTALLLIDPFVAFAAFSSLGLIYFVIVRITRNRLQIDSHCIAVESTQLIKALQEGLGGIRDILLDGTQATYFNIYKKADTPLRRAQGDVQFISQAPRYGSEALGMVVIAALAYAIGKQSDGISNALPILGALALGAQRLLPVLQLAYGSWAGIQGGLGSLQDVLDLLDQPLTDYVDKNVTKSLPFQKQIDMKEISFRYNSESPWVLNNLNLNIPKGSRLGLIGTTGSGKSTLVDIVMGLLQPSQGVIEIDSHPLTLVNNQSWQKNIAHVPQSIFLSDSTIEENIAFGVPKESIDSALVRKSAQQAQISNDIESWPQQYNTLVGERGTRLSGGQCQRIGIARALYKQADVIIFDEATSALDSNTEQAVMKVIENLNSDLTLIIIAHRLTTLKSCTMIVELDNGIIKRSGSYKDLI
jgi:ABC-type bacteriocin/lantibiotic exporter with double-glycine peptidase domain